MAIDIRSRASRKTSAAQTYATADPGRSRSARIGTAVLIALAALWQAFVLRQAQSAEAGEESVSGPEDLAADEGAPAPVLAAVPRGIPAADEDEPAGGTQPLSSGLQGAALSPAAAEAQAAVEAGGGGSASSGSISPGFDGGIAGGTGRPHSSGEGPAAGGGGPSSPSTPDPEAPAPEKPEPEKPEPGRPVPGGETPDEPEPGDGAPTTPEGPVAAGLLPYGLDDLLAELGQILAPQSAADQSALQEVAVGDWLSAARLDSLRRAPETYEGAADWEAYARDRQQIAALETPSAREAYLARFLPGGVDAAAADSPPEPAAAIEPEPFLTDL